MNCIRCDKEIESRGKKYCSQECYRQTRSEQSRPPAPNKREDEVNRLMDMWSRV